jgi:hypothetical protein
MIPSFYKFEVTLDREQIERYNRWRANLPHTSERSIINWVSKPFDDDVMLRSYYDQESNTVVVYRGDGAINKFSEYLILSEPVVRNGGDLAEMMITSSDRILILSVLNKTVYDGMNPHLKLLNIILGTDFETSDDNPVF